MSDVATDATAPLIEKMRADASQLAASIVAAADGGVPQSRIMPELISVLRESGLLPAGMRIPFFG